MQPEPPSPEDLAEVARALGIHLSPRELAAYRRLAGEMLAAYRRVAALPGPGLPVAFPRDGGRQPEPDENPYNAWAWRGRIRGEPQGPLDGLRVVVKDNVCVQGWPMRVGSAALRDYVPEGDATAVTRLLQSGAEIIGKGTCEDLCYSGGSHTSATGPVLNPHDPARMAGGSSSGPAVLVATGEAEAGLGTDQGGSVVIPAAWCGIVGVKPTFGLVPYTGAVGVEPTIDHVGVLARDVHTTARCLDAIAGPDGLDTRQAGVTRPRTLAPARGRPPSDLQVALLDEGFGWSAISDPRVDAVAEREGVERFQAAGACVESASVPIHRHGVDLMHVVWTEGACRTLLCGRGMSATGADHHVEDFMQAMGEGLDERADALSPTVKLVLLLGTYVAQRDQGLHYAKAQNFRTCLRDAYDEALRDRDVLVLPTVPRLPRRLPARDAPPDEVVDAGFQIHNTCPFDLTGHPVASVPAGYVEGLPVGLLLVARHGDEETLLQAADAFARTGPRALSPA